MSKFLDRLEQISLGVSGPIGFGVSRAEKTPGMALVALVSSKHATGCRAVASLAPDAVLLGGITGPEAIKKLAAALTKVPWGVRSDQLTDESSQAYQESGCDLLAFSLEGTPVSAVSSDEIARVLCLDLDADERQLRSIDSLPVDVLLLSLTGQAAPWTLADLASIAAISRRVNKYVLVEVSAPPGKKDLEAIRKVGVDGLVLEVGAVSAKSLAELKESLLDMPRSRPGRRERATAIIPASVFPSGQAPAPEDPDEDDDDDF